MSATTAVVAAAGIESVLAARRAPAFAQGSKLHFVRWNDFIKESDAELKRQMQEASKALGGEITLETINATRAGSPGTTPTTTARSTRTRSRPP